VTHWNSARLITNQYVSVHRENRDSAFVARKASLPKSSRLRSSSFSPRQRELRHLVPFLNWLWTTGRRKHRCSIFFFGAPPKSYHSEFDRSVSAALRMHAFLQSLPHFRHAAVNEDPKRV